MKLWYIREAKYLDLLNDVGLVETGWDSNCFVHKNIMFNPIPYNGVDIYIYQTENINLIHNNKCFRFSRIPMLHVYGNTTEKGINYDWLIRGAWVEYIEEYSKKVELIVDKKNQELKILKEINIEEKEKEFKEKLKPFEIFFKLINK